ncbi:MAG: chromosomal replication initiator protein DnaA [Candidatus Calescibacterium sp.]|nr:chromosomal replication initiator protein DnaA [Candidatus Calescibacterium sp.]MCX7971954.1 chromosomal replication initiator protein DnaA [bacterium]MDW8195460.1 chromosomal replication initiator protein DnaA [Candidatus Calescibacterium sp.]
MEKEFLDLFIEELGQIAYDLCFNISNSYIDKNEKKMYIITTDTSIKEWIEKKYSPFVKEILERYYNDNSWAVEVKLKESEQEVTEISTDVLNPLFSFDNFVVGNSNQFAYAASLAVAQKPGKAYNPLFIYGATGLGKTHLLHAIGNLVYKRKLSKKIIYITSEKFINDLVNAIKEKKIEEFRNKYRKAEVLLIDDVQFISGKERTQEELFHTFNELYLDSKQIVLTSDRPPKDLEGIEERLKSRFQSGLIADVQQPDFETRKAIVKKKIEKYNLEFDEQVIDFLAQKFRSNIREIEGAIIKIVAYTNLNKININKVKMEDILEIIKDVTVEDNKITPDNILEIVSEYFSISKEEILSNSREKRVVYPRHVITYLLRDVLGMSFKGIGNYLKKDHTTIMHSYERINVMLASPKVYRDIANIKEKLYERYH